MPKVSLKFGIKIKLLRIILLLLAMVAPTTSMSSELEDLFNAGQYEAFLEQALPLANEGDVEALFLMGKAHNLGKGVEKDIVEARRYYKHARSKGSVRAAHNLGLILLDTGIRLQAIELFEEALSKGLKMPTYINLARAHSPDDYLIGISRSEWEAQARKAGDFYAKAYAEEPNANRAFDASREYLRVFLSLNKEWVRLATADDTPEKAALRENVLKARAVALEWLKIGTDQNHAPSWANLGVLHREEKNYAAAIDAFEKGAAPNNRYALYFLGEMEEQGTTKSGLKNEERALFYYEKAAEQGMKEAQIPAHKLIVAKLNGEMNTEKLETGIARLKKLGTAFGFYDIDLLTRRLAWIRLFNENKSSPPAGNITLHACALGLDDVYGSAFNLGYNSHWVMMGYKILGETIDIGVEGRVTESGCAISKGPLPAVAKEVLASGGTLVLHFPNYSLPLALRKLGSRYRMEIHPQVTPVSPR